MIPEEVLADSGVVELTRELEAAIATEDYEAAALLRDEIGVEKAREERKASEGGQ
jgi:protein-arginine kinase activator protein McsA